MGVMDYSSTILITFDRPIVVNPEIIIGTEEFTVPCVAVPVYSDSAHYSSYTPDRAFDGALDTQWLNNVARPGWICKDFGGVVTISKLRMYLNTQKPGNFQIQGSLNGTTWVDAYSGSCSATVGWQEFTFTPASYRYWRIYVTTVQTTEIWIYEIEFKHSRPTYQVSGWSVSAEEYPTIEDSVLTLTNYNIAKVRYFKETMLEQPSIAEAVLISTAISQGAIELALNV